jgi:large subunit ribosomal protein L30
MEKKYLNVILKKSLIGCIKSHRSTCFCLGLRKINSSVVLEENSVILGMIRKVRYLLMIERL